MEIAVAGPKEFSLFKYVFIGDNKPPAKPVNFEEAPPLPSKVKLLLRVCERVLSNKRNIQYAQGVVTRDIDIISKLPATVISGDGSGVLFILDPNITGFYCLAPSVIRLMNKFPKSVFILACSYVENVTGNETLHAVRKTLAVAAEQYVARADETDGSSCHGSLPGKSARPDLVEAVDLQKVQAVIAQTKAEQEAMIGEGDISGGKKLQSKLDQLYSLKESILSTLFLRQVSIAQSKEVAAVGALSGYSAQLSCGMNALGCTANDVIPVLAGWMKDGKISVKAALAKLEDQEGRQRTRSYSGGSSGLFLVDHDSATADVFVSKVTNEKVKSREKVALDPEDLGAVSASVSKVTKENNFESPPKSPPASPGGTLLPPADERLKTFKPDGGLGSAAANSVRRNVKY